jgi:hypothetical protein
MQEALLIVAKDVVSGGGDIEGQKAGEAELVAGEEARSGGRGQHRCRHAREAWTEGYEMEQGMPHLLSFLPASIAQPLLPGCALVWGRGTQGAGCGIESNSKVRRGWPRAV